MPDDFASNTTTGTLAVGTTLTGAVETAGDVDWVRVTLEAGQAYGITTGLDTAFDSRILGVYDASGVAVGGLRDNVVDDGPRMPTPSFRGGVYVEATTAGTYYVAVAAQTAGTTGNYTLSLFDDDLPGDALTTGTVAVGERVTGSLDGNFDDDWYALTVEAGQEYFIEMAGKGIHGNTSEYPDLVVLNADGSAATGARLGFSAPGGYTRIDFRPTETGTYLLSASGEYLGIGTFTIEVQKLVPEVPDGPEDAVDLPLDQQLYARVGTNGERDWFKVNLEAGKAYYFEQNIDYFNGGRSGRAGLELRDTSGSVSLASGKTLDALNYRDGLVFAATADGIYNLVAIDNTEGHIGTYAISFRELPSLFFTSGADWLSLPEDVLPRLLAITGGAGSDTMSFAGHTAGVEINLATGLARSAGAEAFSLLMASVENVTGTSHGDRIWGSAAAERVRGLGGNDRFHGSGGADRIEGGAGRDLVDYSGAASGVSASLLRGRGWAGDAAGDRLTSIEMLTGSRHGDTLWGDHGANRLDGGHGDDTLIGNGGDDYILAGFGTDVIVFSSDRDDYIITTNGFRTEVTDLRGIDGHDVLAHAEVLRFADGDLVM